VAFTPQIKKHVIYFSWRKIFAPDPMGHPKSRVFAAVEENSVVAVNVGIGLLIFACLADICPNALPGSRIVKEKTVWEMEMQIFRGKRPLFEAGNRFEQIDKPLMDVKGQPLAATSILP
jgi:hypothetical protein